MKTITLEIPDAIDLEKEKRIKQELIDYLKELLSEDQDEKLPLKRVPKFGCAKGKFHMAPDFDAPLDDFAEYMPS